MPAYPARIALVTSASGAAVRDLLHVLERRWPVSQIRLYPVPVQGIEAPGAISAAIVAANLHGWADILIVGRGGGSLEDLWAFNDETLARTVAASSIPVVSAVGHETDFSICDFVADLRAPTPSAAAELSTPDQFVLKESFHRAQRQLQRRIEGRLQQNGQRLDHLAHRMQQKHPATRLHDQARQLNALSARLGKAARQSQRERALRLDSLTRRLAAHRPDRKLADLGARLETLKKSLDLQLSLALKSRRDRLANLARTLHAVSPLETIGRGYSVLTAAESGEVISRIAQVSAGDDITAQIGDGFLDCSVHKIRKPGNP